MKNKSFLIFILVFLGFVSISLPAQARERRHHHRSTSFNISFGSFFQSRPYYQPVIVTPCPQPCYQPIIVQPSYQPVYVQPYAYQPVVVHHYAPAYYENVGVSFSKDFYR